MLDPPQVSFTTGERTAIMRAVRDAVTVSAYQRFQRKLTRLLEARRRIDKSPKGSLAAYCGKSHQSWVSNLLEQRAVHPRLELEDLENIADFFGVTISELLRPANPKELSAREQRIVLAFQSLPEPLQDHVLAVVEAIQCPRR